EALDQAGVRVELSRYMFEDGNVPSTELFRIAAAIVILLLAFGSIVATGLPITTAIAGVLASVAGAGLWAAVVTTPHFPQQVAAVTLLPALLGFVGRRIDRFAIHRRDHESGRVALRWSRIVQRRPVAAAAAGAGALLVLAAPVFAMRLATADEGNDPATSTTR